MRVYPAVNCLDSACVVSRMKLMHTLGNEWVHIDIADGRFAPVVSWNDVEEFRGIRASYPNLKFQMHLMVENPEEVAREWLDAGADEVIVHVEALSDIQIASKYPEHAIVFGIRSDTAMEDAMPYLAQDSSVLILAVPPGFSGQPFDLSVIEKITTLRERFPELTIIVDGGVNLKTAELVKGSANILIAASYIFGNKDPQKAYRELTAL